MIAEDSAEDSAEKLLIDAALACLSLTEGAHLLPPPIGEIVLWLAQERLIGAFDAYKSSPSPRFPR